MIIILWKFVGIFSKKSYWSYYITRWRSINACLCVPRPNEESFLGWLEAANIQQFKVLLEVYLSSVEVYDIKH